jgi:hypothetical protein
VRFLGKKTRFFDLRRGYLKPFVYELRRQQLLGSRLGRLPGFAANERMKAACAQEVTKTFAGFMR